MENISYVGLSQQMALQRQMEIVANNIANMSTPGYKAQKSLFLEYVNQPKGVATDGQPIKQVMDFATYRDTTEGSLTRTNNDLDVAISGEGYFSVETPDGPRYTRTGSFMLNEKLEIVNKNGYPLLSDGGAGITIQPEATKITITKDGQVSTDAGALGSIKVSTFNNEQDLVPIGKGLYDAGQLEVKPAEDVTLYQGMIEGSNVNPVLEMNRMLEVSRQYQATQRMLMTDHERMRSAIQKLSRTQ